MEEMAEQNEEAFSDFTQNAFSTASVESSEMIADMMTETENSTMNEMFYEELAMVENDALVANVYTDVIENDENQMEYVMENMMENISSNSDTEQTNETNLATEFFEAMIETNPDQFAMMAETDAEMFNDIIAAADPTNVAGSFNDADTMAAMTANMSPKEQRQFDKAMAKEQRQFDKAMEKEQRQYDKAMAKLGYDPNDPYMNDPYMNDPYMNDPMMMGTNDPYYDPYMNDPYYDPYMNDPYYDPYANDPYANNTEDDDTEEDVAYGYDCSGNYGAGLSCGGFAPIEYNGIMYYTQATYDYALNAAGWTWNGAEYASQLMYDDARTLDGTMYDTEIMYNDRLTELYYGGTQYYTQTTYDDAENAASTTVTWTSIDEDADDIFSLGSLYQFSNLSFPATSDGGQTVSYSFDATFNLPASITTADLTSGLFTGPDISYLTAEEYGQTYSFLATATAMIGSETITSDARTFSFFIPEYVTYQTSPN